jgi:O-antigen/teichoic acid export membrane protein
MGSSRASGLSIFLVLKVLGLRHLTWKMPDPALRRAMLHFGGYSMATCVFLSVLFCADVVCLDRFTHNTSLIAHYTIAVFLIDGMLLIPGALVKTLFPYASQLAENPSTLWRHIGSLRRRAFVAALGIASLAALSANMIPSVFGTSYTPTIGFFRWMLIGFVLQTSLMVYRTALLSIGKAREVFYVSIAMAIVNIGLNAVFIGGFCWNATGAIAAGILTNLLGAVLSYAILVRWRVNHATVR